MGSGWVALAYNYHLKSLENYSLWDHGHSPAASVPLLGLVIMCQRLRRDLGDNFKCLIHIHHAVVLPDGIQAISARRRQGSVATFGDALFKVFTLGGILDQRECTTISVAGFSVPPEPTQ